jgi:hypothetical protein
VKSVESPTELSYVARNYVVAPNQGLPVSFTIPGQVTIDIPVGIKTRSPSDPNP